MSSYDDAFQREIVRELSCKPCGEVSAIRTLKDRVAGCFADKERLLGRLAAQSDDEVRMLKAEARVAELMSGLHEIAAILPVHESKELDADNVDDVCCTVKLSIRRYADKVEEVEARVAELDAENKVTRRAAFIRATRDVCSYCGKRALPNEPEAHKVCGPNTAGNYTHLAFGNVQLCPASSIWSTIFWEDAADQRGEGGV